MKIYFLQRKQFLPISLAEAWTFFSSPQNLSVITPAYMKFSIVDISGEEMYSGQIIKYRVNVIPWVRVSWVTEITSVNAPTCFVDEQRSGPYRLWVHRHLFREMPGGVEMIDEVSYAIPFGLLGRFAHWLFVRRQLNSIFDFRFRMLDNFFKHNTVLKSA